jgi:hypothetical protein
MDFVTGFTLRRKTDGELSALFHAFNQALAAKKPFTREWGDAVISVNNIPGLSRPSLDQLDHALCGVGLGPVQKHLGQRVISRVANGDGQTSSVNRAGGSRPCRALPHKEVFERIPRRDAHWRHERPESPD